MSIFVRSRNFGARAPEKLWWVCLLVLGPITGVLVGLCITSLKAGRPYLAAGCVAAIAAFWIGAPTLLGFELSMLPGAAKAMIRP